MNSLIRRVQVNVPFTLLLEKYGEAVLRLGINPEVGLDAQALDRFKPLDHRPLAEALLAMGRSVTLHAPFLDLSPGSPDPEIRRVTQKRFDQLLDWVPIFRPLTVVAHTGYDYTRYGPMQEPWLTESALFWTRVANRLQSTGTHLMLENVYDYGPDEMEMLLRALHHPNVGFCLDTGHQAAFGCTPLERWLEVMAPFLGQLHLHDNDGRRDLHLAIGAGSIDFRGFFRQLASLRATPPVITLEPHRETDLEPSLEALAVLWPW